MIRTGKVWIVGAGPGDVGLLTLQAFKVLKEADVIVYDRLVGGGIMSLAPEGAELIDVGKSGGRHPVPQREIEAILVDRARAGKRVVRLKGGDPFLFGRGSEEALALLENHVPFEIVSGITSAIAVPTWAGIPVTHRKLAQSLHIVTAHTEENGIPDLDYDALVRQGGTLVLLMGVAHVDTICKKLIESGMSSDTCAAAIERGTTARQKRVLSKLSGLPEAMKTAGINPPAILIIGETVGLAESLDWRSKLPLNGVRVAVTRPKERSGRLVRMLRDAGAEVIEMPCIATEPLDEMLPSLKFSDTQDADWVVFTSATGVSALMTLLAREGRDIRELGRAKLAAIGPATADALKAHGLHVDLMPDIYDGEHLGLALSNLNPKPNSVLLLRAEERGPELTQTLTSHDINYREITLYRTRFISGPMPADLNMAIFTSTSTVKAFKARANESWSGWNTVQAVCIGKQTAKAAENEGFKKITVAAAATLEELVKTACDAAHR